METTAARQPRGIPTGGQFAPSVHAEPDVDLGGTVDAVEDYRMGHRAPKDDGYSNPITRLADSFGDDVLEHPEWYGSGEIDEETLAQLKKVAADPDATVRVYRALPPGIGQVNKGDWVTLSEQYARQHAIQDEDEANDWPIVHADVPARLVFTDGNDLAEYGYDGDPVHGLEDRPRDAAPAEGPAAADGTAGETAEEYARRTADEWSQGDPHLAEAQRALLDGSARSLLAERFKASGMDDAELAAAVGAPRLVAKRVVAGKEPLNATTVAAYLRALGAPRRA